MAFIKYYAHTNGATKFVMDCSNVVGGVVARLWFASDHVRVGIVPHNLHNIQIS